jgi:hypothetical protein
MSTAREVQTGFTPADDTDEGEGAADVFARRRGAAGSVLQTCAGSRLASARTDSGLRSGRATDRGRPTLPLRSGTAKLVSAPQTLI